MSDICPVKLFHGTSSIFLTDILKSGLGAARIAEEWGILEMARVIYPMVRDQFADHNMFGTFEKMVNQECRGLMNFQHGDVYVSVCRKTAAGYPAGRRWGSELLTSTLTFLQKLAETKNPRIVKDLYRKHTRLFDLVSIPSSPLLIELDGIPYESLLMESGEPVSEEVKSNIQKLSSAPWDEDDMPLVNFRLKQVVPKEGMKIYLVDVKKYGNFVFEYELHPLAV